MKRKFVSWCVILTMAAGSLAACGNNGAAKGAFGQQETAEGLNIQETSGQQETEQKETEQKETEQSGENAAIGEGRKAAIDEPTAEKVSGSFAKKLLRAALEERNPVLSPISAYLALELAGCGAAGDTAEEFDKVLGSEALGEAQRMLEIFSRGEEELCALPPDSSINIMSPKGSEEGVRVLIANSAWIDTRLRPEQEWVEGVESRLQAQVHRMKLSTAEAQSSINDWVEENTEGLIPGFLSQPLEDNCRLALFNTVYFQGKWQSPFEKTSTHERGFCLENKSDSSTCPEMVLTQMMRKYDEKIAYIGAEACEQTGADLCEGVVLPYRNSSMVFVALKPAGGQTVRELYENLTLAEISSLVEKSQTESLDLMLPKFRITYDRVLNEDLEQMGLHTAFDTALADFSGIGSTDSGEGIHIDLVCQKVVFILDEEGTEAAAATMASLQANCAMRTEEPRQVYFDEPFLYLILDTEEQMPLFMGIMDNPSLE